MKVNVNFADPNQSFALRTTLLGELEAQGGLLTHSENTALEEKLWQMCVARDAAAAQGAYKDFSDMLSAMSGNSFKVETLAQKTDVAAGVDVEQGLRNDLTKLNARVEYLSRFGGSGDTAFLTEAQTTLLRGYLDRAESRLRFYAKQGDEELGLTVEEAAAVRKALTGIAEIGDPANGAVNLIADVLATI